jgi:hypothetical protein
LLALAWERVSERRWVERVKKMGAMRVGGGVWDGGGGGVSKPARWREGRAILLNDELWSMLIMHDRAVMNNSFCLLVCLFICLLICR